MRTLVLDNGSYEIKLGYTTEERPFRVKNAMMRSRDRRLWLGNAVDMCKDLTGLQFRRPIERGQLYSWELEKAIWDWTWDTRRVVDSVDEFKETTLLLSESPGSLPSSSINTDQIIFEELEFARYRRCPSQVLVANAPVEKSCAKLVIDLGFHATHVVPVIDNVNAIYVGTRRLDVGGKILTNYLKETVSFRYYNMMEETAILGRIKERACLVSQDFRRDLEIWNRDRLAKKYSPWAMGYALPTSPEDDPYGHVISSLDEAVEEQKSGDQQVLILDNERFAIPEALFDPRAHLGLDQAPLPEVVASSIAACPEEYQELLWSNIVVSGGTANLPGLSERLTSELRKWAPADVPLQLQFSSGNDNIEAAWQGGCNIAAPESGFNLDSWTASREEYLEQGQAYVARKFAATNKWKPPKA